MDIIELLKSAFMGLVEGITEWLPVSSTGHMILVDEFVKMNVSETFWNMFLVVIQLGAILAVCVLFFHELNPFSPSKGKEGRRDTWVLWGKIVLGCIPAAAIGLPLNDWMEEHFYNAPVVALALIVYGVLFIVIENWRANKREEMAVAGSFGSRAVVSGGRPAGAHFAAPAAATAEDEDDDENLDFGSIATLEDLSWKTALGIGCFQVLSLVPGTSRSGSTIIGGLLDTDTLKAIVEVARKHDAWVLCDEVYRLLTQTDEYSESVIDLYDKAIVTASMSKVWSFAGLRLGWAVTKSPELRRALLSHRDYNLISAGIFSETVAELILGNASVILERSRRIVRQNLAVLEKWVESEPHLSFVKPEAGTTALVYYDYDIDSRTFCIDMIKKSGALVTPGDCFEEPKSMRIGYAYSDNTDDLQKGLDAISAYMRTLE